MANMMIRNLPDDVHGKLKERAVSNSRSLEAEARSILASAVSGKGFGTELCVLFDGVEGDELDAPRDEMPKAPVSFE